MSLNLTLILVFSAIGILDTLYLSYHSFTKTPAKCLFFPQEWCRKVQQSKYSRLFIIPNSYLGLSLYSAIFILTLLVSKGMLSFAPVAALIGFGFLFSLLFMYLQAFVIKAFCTWCVLSAIDFIVLSFFAYHIWIG